jgi:hypothetical protein
MSEPASLSFSAWENFYVIVGSSAGALTGLQFVVLTLIAEARAVRGSVQSISAFGSPNVVHFCTALFLSSLFSVPWRQSLPLAIITVAAGVAGVLYAITVMRRAQRQRDYKPVLEDWLWHVGLPLLAYTALLFGGILLLQGSLDAQYFVGGTSLLLVFVGIHNAWDTVMYIMEREQASKAGAAANDRDEEAPPRTPSSTSAAARTSKG